MRLTRAVLFCLLAATLLSAAPLGASSPAPWASGRSRGTDLSVTLVTIAPSEPIYTWWGHSALIVEDTRLGFSRFYNYGLFSFEQDNFLLNFAMGRLWFQVGASATERELAYYRARNRSIRLQALDLSPEKRLEMARFLETNILPQNRTYLYDHYYDNCSTRVRDLIDKMVDGQLFQATNVPARLTLRQSTRRYTRPHAFMDWLLMFLMSDTIDRPVTQWEQMYLPDELERHVGELVYRDEQGRQRRLVSSSTLYYQAAVRPDSPEELSLAPRRNLDRSLTLLAGLLLGGAAVALALWASRSKRAGRVAFGIYNALMGLALGIPGTVLFFMSKFTDHWVTYANENLFLANPLALIAVPLGVALASGGRRGSRWLPVLWYFLSAVALVYLALKELPVFRQDNWLAVTSLLPILLGFSGAFVLRRRSLS